MVPFGIFATKTAVVAAIPMAGKEKLESLADLPDHWWKTVPNDPGGYQYRTETHVMKKPVQTLFDGCAGVNSVTEEWVCGVSKNSQVRVLGCIA